MSAAPTDQTWMGNRFDLFMTSYNTGSDNYSTLKATNPNLIILVYTSGQGFYKSPLDATWIDFRDWMANNSINMEDAFFHMDDRMTYTISNRDRAVLISTYAPGIVPGVTQDGVPLSWARAINGFSYGATETSASKFISTLTRASNVVTLVTTSPHGFTHIGDYIYVSIASPWTGVFQITDIPDTTTLKYTQTLADDNTTGGTVYWYGPIRRTISAISRVQGTSTVTITTSTNHGWSAKDVVKVEGVTDSSFNGTFELLTASTNTATYTQAGTDASSSGGTAGWWGWTNFYSNWGPGAVGGAYARRDYIAYKFANGWGQDQVGTIYDGIFNDSQLDVYEGLGGSGREPYSGLAKMKEYKDWKAIPGNESKTLFQWYREILTASNEYVRSAISTFTGKPAYIMCNADDTGYYGTETAAFYQQPTGSDFALFEKGLTPNMGPGTDTTFKSVFELVSTYNKKVVQEGYVDTTHTYYNNDPNGVEHWTQVPATNIWYTDYFSNQTLDFITVGSYTRRYSYETLTQGSFYWNSNTKILYVWDSSNRDPNAVSLNYLPLDESKMGSLAIYYIFVRYGDNGYYFPWFSGTTYNVQPQDPKNWFDAIECNIGSPTSGGLKRDNAGNWTTATDLWGESSATSSKPYLLWQGNGSETDDYGNAMTTNAKLLARKYTNGVAVVRTKQSSSDTTDRQGTKRKTFTTPFNFKRLYANGSIGPVTNTFTIGQGEGAILITNWAGNKTMTIGGGSKTLTIGGGDKTISW